MTQKCLLVLGMHRSGTSALTRVLNIMGARLPAETMGAGVSNPTGHWEPSRLTAYHDRFLAEFGSVWHDWRPLKITQMLMSRRHQVKTDILNLVQQEYGNAKFFVIKDPRISRFAPLFIDALTDGGIEVVPIIVFRNPLEVSASLMQRQADWPETYGITNATLLWLTHCLAAEKATRSMKRAFISYTSLMENWEDAVASISNNAGIAFPVSPSEARPIVEHFLTPSLRHHENQPNDVALHPQMGEWVTETFEALSILEASAVSDFATERLDKVHGLLHQSQFIISDVFEQSNSKLNAAKATTEKLLSEVKVLTAKHGELEDLLQKNQQATEAEKKRLENDIYTLDLELRKSTNSLSKAYDAFGRSQNQGDNTDLASLIEKSKEDLNNTKLALKRARAEIEASNTKLTQTLENKEHLTQDLTRQIETAQAQLTQTLEDKEQLAQNFARQIETVQANCDDMQKQKAVVEHKLSDSVESLQRKNLRVELIERKLNTIQSSVGWSLLFPIRAFSKIVERRQENRDKELILSSQLFDQNWYLKQNPELAEQDVDPALHYLRHGAYEGRQPSQLFDSFFYLTNNSDVSMAGVNPLVHFLKFGQAEGRLALKPPDQ